MVDRCLVSGLDRCARGLHCSCHAWQTLLRLRLNVLRACSSCAVLPTLQDSHDDGEGRAAALRSFHQELDLVRRVLAPLEGQLRGAFPSGAAAEPQLIA